MNEQEIFKQKEIEFRKNLSDFVFTNSDKYGVLVVCAGLTRFVAEMVNNQKGDTRRGIIELFNETLDE
jgi:hypothetical protein